jgi:invasion protein IalB
MIRRTAIAIGALLALTTALTGAAQEFPEPPDPPNWLISCSNQANFDELLCEFSQSIILTDQTGRAQRVSTASFMRVAGETGTEARFSLPYEVSLRDDVTISVDENVLGALSWQSCDSGGCYASGPVEDDWMQAMREGNQLAAALKARDGRDITFTFALDDFSMAADMLP